MALGGQVAAQIYGTAPVQQPTGGFGIDGDGYTNYPTNGIGDWFDYTPPTLTGGGTIFNMETPEPYDLNYPLISIHYNDYWGNGVDPTSFTSSTKIHHPYDETFTWGPGQVLDKNEISNATMLFTRGDPALGGNANDLWCVFAADRQVNNGDAYIDFEFLQNPLYQVPYPDNPNSGYFVGEGPHGTRTIGDILVTIQFENGGTNAIPTVHKWVAIGSSYGWEVLPLTEWPASSLYMTSNQEVTTAPWLPFGQPSYLVNQFAEGAINLSAFIPGIGFDECNYLATIFVRTKTSQSTTAELKDFPGAPYQLDMTPNLVCAEDTTVAACSSLTEIEAAYAEWAAGFSFGGGVDPVTDNLDDLPATFADLLALQGVEITACGGSYTFTLEVQDACMDVPETCESTFTVLPSDLVVSCPDPVSLPACTPLADIQAAYATWVSGFSVTGGCEPISNISGIPTLPENVACLGANLSFTFTADNGEGYCEDEESCTSTFVVAADVPVDVTCATAVNLPACTPYADIQTAYATWAAGFSFTGGCGATSNITQIPSLPTDFCDGVDLSFTYSASDNCSSDQCTSTFVVDPDLDAPDLICPSNFSQWCPDVVILTPPEYSDNCTAYEDILLEYSFDGGAYLVPTFPLYFNDLTPGIHTLEYRTTDDCGNVATCTFTIDITYDCEEDVDYVLNNGNPVFCGMVNNTLTATINVPYASVSWSLAPGSDWVITGPINGTSVTFNAMEDGSATFILTIMDVNGCTVTCEYTIECAPAAENCTLTMGGWGQPGGSYCDGLSQHDRLVQILTPNGVTVGRPGHSYTSTSGEAGAVCVEDVLPSGGPAAALNKDYICYENNNNLKKNILLGQSLTLAINIGNSEGLAGLPLNTSFLIADNYEASCGTVPDAYTFSYMTLSVPQNVVNYLNAHYQSFGGATVGALMEFANDALGKVYIPSSGNPSFSNISDAATVINEAFDENCKWAIINEFVASAPIAQGNTVQSEDPNVMMSISPNPFQDQVEIKYNLKTDSRVSLELYNLQGVKVYTIYEGEAKAGFEYSHKFAPAGNRSEQVFLVVLKSVYGATTRQIIKIY